MMISGSEWFIQKMNENYVEIFVALIMHLEEEGWGDGNHLLDDIHSWAEKTLKIKLPRDMPEFTLQSTEFLYTEGEPEPRAVYLRSKGGKVTKYSLSEVKR